MNRKLTIFSIISLAFLLFVMTSCFVPWDPAPQADLYISNKTDDTLDIVALYHDIIQKEDSNSLYDLKPGLKGNLIWFYDKNTSLDTLISYFDTVKVYHNGQLLKVWSRTDTIAPGEHHFFNPASWIIEKECDLELCATFEILPEDISKK